MGHLGIDPLAPDLEIGAAELSQLIGELRRGGEGEVGEVEDRGQDPVGQLHAHLAQARNRHVAAWGRQEGWGIVWVDGGG